MQYIGKLDKRKLGIYKNSIITDEVILTEERRKHIYDKHYTDYNIIIKNIKNVVINPNEVIEDIKNKDTIFLINKIGKNHLNVIIKLNTSDIKHIYNSIMTAWIIRDSNLRKLRKNNRIIYKNE